MADALADGCGLVLSLEKTSLALPELKDILIFGGRAHSQRVWQAIIDKGIDPRTQTPLAAAGSGSRASTRSLAAAGIPQTPSSARAARKKRGKRG